ncbi:MAG: hypothetical protein E7205_02260 [Tissierellaceae bacterium]|nr:hypothetical protein [Tissierellaceae bacterium]
MNIKEATTQWINTFNAIPKSLIIKAYKNDIDSITELTSVKYECVYCGKKYTEKEAEKMSYRCNCLNYNTFDHPFLKKVEHDSWLPMWGWMWTFFSISDEEWAKKHLEEMSSCDFRIYESDELGIFFGIDGAGYDFYEHHWIPLYKKRGLKWYNNVK